MIQCPKCQAHNTPGSPICSFCGESLLPSSHMPAADAVVVEYPEALKAPRMGFAITSLILGIVAFLASLFVK